MQLTRNGHHPRVHPAAKICASAQIVGDVTIGSGCYVDHSVVIESGGPPIELADDVIVFAGSVIRSVGGRSRPAFPVTIAHRTLISPLCVLTGCRIGCGCYVATNVVVLQGASIGDHSRIGAGAIVHANVRVPALTRVGMRHIAVETPDGFASHADVERAREAVADSNFFEVAFEASDTDQAALHEGIIQRLLDEVHGWLDEP